MTTYNPTDYYPTTVRFSAMIEDTLETIGYDETLNVVARAIRVYDVRNLSIMLGNIVYNGKALRAGDRRRVRAAINAALEI